MCCSSGPQAPRASLWPSQPGRLRLATPHALRNPRMPEVGAALHRARSRASASPLEPVHVRSPPQAAPPPPATVTTSEDETAMDDRSSCVAWRERPRLAMRACSSSPEGALQLVRHPSGLRGVGQTRELAEPRRRLVLELAEAGPRPPLAPAAVTRARADASRRVSAQRATAPPGAACRVPGLVAGDLRHHVAHVRVLRRARLQRSRSLWLRASALRDALSRAASTGLRTAPPASRWPGDRVAVHIGHFR